MKRVNIIIFFLTPYLVLGETDIELADQQARLFFAPTTLVISTSQVISLLTALVGPILLTLPILLAVLPFLLNSVGGGGGDGGNNQGYGHSGGGGGYGYGYDTYDYGSYGGGHGGGYGGGYGDHYYRKRRLFKKRNASNLEAKTTTQILRQAFDPSQPNNEIHKCKTFTFILQAWAVVVFVVLLAVEVVVCSSDVQNGHESFEDYDLSSGRTFGVSNISLTITYVTFVVALVMLLGFMWVTFAFSGGAGYNRRRAYATKMSDWVWDHIDPNYDGIYRFRRSPEEKEDQGGCSFEFSLIKMLRNCSSYVLPPLQ